MKAKIKDLLESLISEVSLDEENTDVIIHEYAERILDILDDNDSDIFYPEDLPYID